MSQPTVSVLVPCYNKAAYLNATLESVYGQSLRDYEVIVVDDGSTDGSAELLHAHEHRARVLYGPNQGASAARARALQHARGRYVQYLDADDLLLPDALASRVDAIVASGADVAYADYQRFTAAADGALVRGERVSLRIEDVAADPEVACFGRFWRPPVALLYSRAITERVSWNPALPVIQDARYLLDAALAGARFVHVPGVSALYRDDAVASLSRRSRPAFARDVVLNADQIAEIWNARGALGDAQHEALRGCYDWAARVVFEHDLEVFHHCVRQLRALDALRALSWPRIAASLLTLLGPQRTTRVLQALGRGPG